MTPTSHQTPPGVDPVPTRRRFPYGLLAVGLLIAGAVLWLSYDRVSRLERTVTDLEQAVAEVGERAGSAGRRADAATHRADAAERAAAAAGVRIGQAEDLAKQEAARRATAEGVAQAAETEAEIARQDAERAADAARAAEAETERIREARDREISRLQEVLDGIAPTRRTALGLVMNLGSDSINFEYDKADLKPEDRELLARIIGVLLTTTGFRIQVFGHTDDIASQKYNQVLSERRAQAVTDYLVAGGIDPEIITTKGFGKLKPLVEGTSEQARARNRRVELGIIDAAVEFTSATKIRRDRR